MMAAIFRSPNSQDVKRLVKIFEIVSEKIAGTIKDPLARPRETVIIIGILVVLFLILVVLLLTMAAVKHDLEHMPPKKQKAKKRMSPQQRRASFLAITVLTIALFVYSLVATSSPDLCSQCHLIDKEYQTWKTSTHKKISCLACHTDPGVFGFIIGKIQGLDNLIAYFDHSDDVSLSAMVRNGSCLACHQASMIKNSSTRGVLVSHKEIQKAGFFCTECHAGLVHGSQQKTFQMDKCITCHDSKKNSSQCALCHPVDIAYRPGQSLEDFGKVQLDEPTSCRGCHSQELEQACSNCHRGIEMPHTAQFIGGGHARLGFINKKTCYWCHPEPVFCARCHLGVSGHTGSWGAHGSEWIKNHQRRNASDCNRPPCHRNPNICARCH